METRETRQAGVAVRLTAGRSAIGSIWNCGAEQFGDRVPVPRA